MRNRRERHRSRSRFTFEQLEARLVLDASMLRITEFLASNDNGLTDADGDSSDWIEIYNSGAETVDLSGIHLTDDEDNLTRWAFPSGTSLAGGAYLVVFASSKTGVLGGGELHTNFAISAGGEYLAIVDADGATIIDEYVPDFPPQFEDISYGREMAITGSSVLVASGAAGRALRPADGSLGTDWTGVDFVDTSWPISGFSGFGYEARPGDAINFTSQIQTPVPTATTSLYIRVPFTLDSLGGVDRLTLRMKYDDGFVAYINGMAVAEENAPEVLEWDSIATGNHTDSAAIQFVDFDVSGAISQLRAGENVLAIHGLNLTNSTDMLILPELIAESATIVEPEKFGFFEDPTPGYGNGAAVAGYTADPRFGVPHGFYETAQSVTISSVTDGAIVVYTTDGSTPEVDANLNVVNGTLYTGPINVSSTTTLRARAFKQDFKPSFTSASTYLFLDDVILQSPSGQVPAGWPASGAVNGQRMDYGIDPDIINLYGEEAVKNSLRSLSAISITTDLENLFDPDIGIYVNAGNRGRSWERPATIELIHPDGTDGFEANAGMRIRGGFSRGDMHPKHALRFYFRGEYGDGKLRYALYGDEGTDRFDVLDLRTSQNYAWTHTLNDPTQNTFLREVFGRDTQAAMGQPHTRSTYHHLYINGIYYGLYQTQERVEEHYGASYFGGHEDDYDVVKHGGNLGRTEIGSGNDLAWRQLFEYGEALAANPAGNGDLYWTMQGLNPDGTRNPELPVLLDAENVIDYMLVIFYTGGFDTGITRFGGNNRANNWFGIYNREAADEGFKFFIHDNEHSMGTGPNHDTQSIDRTGPFNNGNQSNYDQFNPAYLHQDLLASIEYRQLFKDRVQMHFFNGGTLTQESILERFGTRKSQVEPAIIAEAARWGDSAVSTPHDKTTWQNEVNWLLDTYFPMRGNLVLNQLAADGLVANVAAPVLSQHGGEVPTNYQLTLTGTGGTIYYSTDGVTDPRAIGGEVNSSPEVKIYTGPITIAAGTTVIARQSADGRAWSAKVEATFTTAGLLGDYNGDLVVDDGDYLDWKANFGAMVPAGTGADGNANGVVDAADFTIWRDRRGMGLPAARDGSAKMVDVPGISAAGAEGQSADSSTVIAWRNNPLSALAERNAGGDAVRPARMEAKSQPGQSPRDVRTAALLAMLRGGITPPGENAARADGEVLEAAFAELEFEEAVAIDWSEIAPAFSVRMEAAI